MKKIKSIVFVFVFMALVGNLSWGLNEMISLDQDQLSNIYNNISKSSFQKEIENIQNIYFLLRTDGNKEKYNEYINLTNRTFNKIIENYDLLNASMRGIEYGVYLDVYVEFLSNMDISERDAFLTLNGKIIEYFQNKYLQAKENNSTPEIRIYKSALKKVRFLVGRGISIN